MLMRMGVGEMNQNVPKQTAIWIYYVQVPRQSAIYISYYMLYRMGVGGMNQHEEMPWESVIYLSHYMLMRMGVGMNQHEEMRGVQFKYIVVCLWEWFSIS